MVEKRETSVGGQVMLALLILFAAWVVLKWVVKVVTFVATIVVVLGLLFIAAWLFFGHQNRAPK